MARFLLKWFISTIALLVVVYIFPGVASQDFISTLIMALVLGLLNTFLKPILSLLSLPIMLLTLGLFTLVINAFTFYLAAHLVHGFYVSGFWSAFGAALIYSIVTFLINSLIFSDKNERDIICCKIFYRK
jgi:putative membrane protein